MSEWEPGRESSIRPIKRGMRKTYTKRFERMKPLIRMILHKTMDTYSLSKPGYKWRQ